jgi:hypothetical protein
VAEGKREKWRELSEWDSGDITYEVLGREFRE